jgi:hypothetical protein
MAADEHRRLLLDNFSYHETARRTAPAKKSACRSEWHGNCCSERLGDCGDACGLISASIVFQRVKWDISLKDVSATGISPTLKEGERASKSVLMVLHETKK